MRLATLPFLKHSLAAAAGAAMLLAAGAVEAAPSHGGGGNNHNWNPRDNHRINRFDTHDRGHSYHSGGRSRSSFSLNIFSAPRPYYNPYPVYPTNYYYAPAPVYPQPVSYAPPAQPINYSSPPSVYGDGRYCREYTKSVNVGGRMQQSYGTACMQPDGDWEIDS